MNRRRKAQTEFLEQIFEHQGILHRVCSVYTSAPQDHEDLYQEILMQGWQSYESFRGGAKFSTWLYRVALNTALVRRRKTLREREVTLEAAANGSVATEDSVDRGSDIAVLHRCIRQLPTLNRAIILLYLEQRSHEEMAEITGLSRTNISVRLVRIRRHLKQLLVENGYHEG